MTTTWDAAFEAVPADTDEAKYGADVIRDLKVAVSERLELEMNFKTGTQPLIKAGVAAVIYQGTTTEIVALDTAAVSSDGALAWDTTLKTFKRSVSHVFGRIGEIPSGTKMLFYADVAPAGWTIDNTLNDKVVFVTKGSAAGGQTGGGAHSTGSWTISGIAADSHVLTTAEMPAHTHSEQGVGAGNSLASGVNYGAPFTTSGSTGGGGGHVHTATHTPGWRPAAYCCIICSKD